MTAFGGIARPSDGEGMAVRTHRAVSEFHVCCPASSGPSSAPSPGRRVYSREGGRGRRTHPNPLRSPETRIANRVAQLWQAGSPTGSMRVEACLSRMLHEDVMGVECAVALALGVTYAGTQILETAAWVAWRRWSGGSHGSSRLSNPPVTSEPSFLLRA